MATPSAPDSARRRRLLPTWPGSRWPVGPALRLAGIAALVAFAIGLSTSLHVVTENRYWTYGARLNIVTEVGRATVAHVLRGLPWAGGLLLMGILSRAVLARRPWPSEPWTLAARAMGGLVLVAIAYVTARRVVPRLPASSEIMAILVDVALLAGSVALVWLLGRPWWVRVVASVPTLWLARLGFLAAAAAVAMALTPTVLRATASPSRPNVLLVVIDTLRADRLGLFGHEPDNAPRLREFARTATFFRQAVSHAPWTSPSVASLLTSRFPGEMGFADSQGPKVFPRQFLTLSEMLREEGYETAALVSHTFVGHQVGFDQGFDIWDQENAQGSERVSSPSLVAKASRFLRERRRGGAPFFLFVHLFDPHFRYVRHPGEAPGDAGQPMAAVDRNRRETTVEDLSRPSPGLARDELELYDGEIRFTDRHVGRLLDELRELHLFDTTLIVVTADHGEMFMDRGIPWIGHGTTLYQELIHVPLVVRVPGQTQGFIVDQRVGLIDVVPSLAKLLELSLPDAVELRGRALPLGDPHAWSLVSSVPQFAETRARGRWLQSAVWGGWKLIVDRVSDRRELYRLADDPGETEDLAAREVQTVERLSEAIDAWNGSLRVEEAGVQSRDAEFTETEKDQLEALGYAQ